MTTPVVVSDLTLLVHFFRLEEASPLLQNVFGFLLQRSHLPVSVPSFRFHDTKYVAIPISSPLTFLVLFARKLGPLNTKKSFFSMNTIPSNYALAPTPIANFCFCVSFSDLPLGLFPRSVLSLY